MAVLGLCCCSQAFSSWGERGLFLEMCGLIAVASLARAWALGMCTSVVAAHRLSCGIFSDQGSNPRPLHWQADSLPRSH